MDVYVKEGDLVKKGAPLLRVDPTQQASLTSVQEAGLRAQQADVQNQIAAMTTAENAINTARASLVTFQADLERANVERNNAEIELKRASSLLEDGIGSRQNYDTAKMRYDSCIASVNAAKARVDQAKTAIDAAKARAAAQQASLDQQSDLLRKTTQYATIDGVVGGPIVQVGTFALANFSSTQLMLIADMSTINVDVNVDETDISNVKMDQKAKVKVDALGEIEIEGQVVEIAQTAKTRSGATIAQTSTTGSQEAKDFKVTVRLVNMSADVRDRLRPGMSATAVISTDRRENVLAVPLQALVERDPDQIKAASGAKPAATPAQNQNQNPKDKKPVKGLFVIQNNKTVFAPVETGITGDNDIEIKSGLTEGQEIVIGPYRQLRTLKNDQAIKREDKNKKPAGAPGNDGK
jgi:HlyD family secretion protein